MAQLQGSAQRGSFWTVQRATRETTLSKRSHHRFQQLNWNRFKIAKIVVLATKKRIILILILNWRLYQGQYRALVHANALESSSFKTGILTIAFFHLISPKPISRYFTEIKSEFSTPRWQLPSKTAITISIQNSSPDQTDICIHIRAWEATPKCSTKGSDLGLSNASSWSKPRPQKTSKNTCKMQIL